MDRGLSSDVLGVARDLAVSSVDWPDEYERLVVRDSETGLSAVELERLAEAAFWTGRGQERVAAFERAYAAHTREGNTRRAGAAAIELYVAFRGRGNQTAAEGWFAAGRRLLEGDTDCVEHGMMLYHLGDRVVGDLDQALGITDRLMQLADRLGDRDLQAMANFGHGWFLVRAGEVERGLALIDEATVAAISGEVSMLSTSEIYCGTIMACRDLGDYRRAGAWTEAANRWCERQSISGFPGECRVFRAEMLLMQGAWVEAEADARSAWEELSGCAPVLAGDALYGLAEVRRRLGDAAGAEQAYVQAHGLGRDPQPGLALLRLAEGRSGAAAAMLQSALDDPAGDRLWRANLLPAEVEVALAVGDANRARRATDELESTAKAFGTPMLEARACGGRVELMLATGDPKAVPEARRCLRLWRELEAPYHAARARVLLARALRASSNSDEAELELAVARADLERLGAAFDLAALDRPDEGSTEPERTLMFTDIVSSTALVEAIGDEAWQRLVGWHDRTLRSLFADHGGEEIDHAGDGFFVAFHDTASAVGAAVAIQRRLANHRQEAGFAPQVRIGIHACSTIAGGRDYGGKGVHTAARIAAAAGGDEILISMSSLGDGDGGHTLTHPRCLSLKGLSKPVDVTTVSWR